MFKSSRCSTKKTLNHHISWSCPKLGIHSRRHQIVGPRFPTHHLPAPLNHHTLNLKMCLNAAGQKSVEWTILVHMEEKKSMKKYHHLIHLPDSSICICLITDFQCYFWAVFLGDFILFQGFNKGSAGVVWILSRDHIWGWGDPVSSGENFSSL